ncbi:MAG: 23S rRNA (guanosine(2251)-2'-O)-methyltransferase RlmB [Oscillospiraceae bacterium]|jgi:23S rRNA (guanosine2251-2'-O)-methyltransferase|nr:23S rRNA (guanosine(2251)-2'-O)-methyltransferase RlmB [Oscillospiraceae bacterium]
MSFLEGGDDLIIGRGAVLEAIRAGRGIDALFIAKGDRVGSIGKIISSCRDLGVPIKEVDSKKLDSMCNGANHQGVAASVPAHSYCGVDDILNAASQKNEEPFIVICDEIEDPHNLGAIIRSAECAGAHGVIIPKRRSASLSFAVSKVSAGALHHLPVARVANLSAAIDDLKKKGLWIYGADMQGLTWCQTDLKGALALIIGSEGSGLGRLIKEKCDFLVSLPMKGKIESLNASVAAGIIMFEVSRQRSGLGNY